jgi:hypothetical protein
MELYLVHHDCYREPEQGKGRRKEEKDWSVEGLLRRRIGGRRLAYTCLEKTEALHRLTTSF